MKRIEMPISNEIIATLEAVNHGPCLTLYQETHRSSPDNKQDQIRFRKLVKALEASLKEKYPEAGLKNLMKPFETLGNDSDFWEHTKEGLAVLVGLDLFHVFRLQRPVRELAMAEKRFFLEPLRRFMQSVDRFQILGLSLKKFQIFEGSRNSLDEIIPEPGVLVTAQAVWGENRNENENSVSSHYGIGHGAVPAHHSYSDKQNEIDIETEKYFRAVDKTVSEFYSRPSGLPLVLACLPEHQELFHRISSNPFLLTEGLDINPEYLPLNDLKERAWQLFEPHYMNRMATLADEFIAAQAKGLGSDDPAQIAQAAADGRVATLLIEANRQDDAETEKKIEELAVLVGKMGGEVQIIPAEHMPVRTAVAASYRY